MHEFVQLITTVASQADAEQIAAHLVEARLAGCVQIVGPIRSVYRWQGAVESAEEWQCWIKTRTALVDAVQTAIRAVHKYDTPEMLVVPVLGGNADYLAWLREQTEAAE